MLILKHLKTLQHVSIVIQIIIRVFVGSLLKLLNLKFNCQRLNVVMRQHNVWYKCVMFLEYACTSIEDVQAYSTSYTVLTRLA